jgi:hypothetical protein
LSSPNKYPWYETKKYTHPGPFVYDRTLDHHVVIVTSVRQTSRKLLVVNCVKLVVLPLPHPQGHLRPLLEIFGLIGVNPHLHGLELWRHRKRVSQRQRCDTGVAAATVDDDDAAADAADANGGDDGGCDKFVGLLLGREV